MKELEFYRCFRDLETLKILVLETWGQRFKKVGLPNFLRLFGEKEMAREKEQQKGDMKKKRRKYYGCL